MIGASKVSRIVIAELAVLLAGIIRLPGADPTWLKLTSPNFEVYTSAGKGTGRDAIRHFEQIHQFFQELTSVRPDTSNRVRIIIFRSNKEYEPFKPNEFATAYYLGTHDRDYIIIGGETKNNRQAAIHEYLHLLVKHSDTTLPPWLNEGFAELYSTLTPFAGKIKIGDLIPGRLQVLQQNKWLDLETLTAVDHDSVHDNERDRAGVFYSQSWALTHMLALSKPYHQGFRDFLLNIARGGNAEGAFRQVYGRGFDEVYKDLKTYASGGNTFYAAFYDLRLAKLAEEPAVADASGFEVNLILANMLSQSRGKADAAQRMLDELEKQNPESWEVAETRGYLELRQRRNDEARMYFSNAVARGSSNPQIYYDLARLTGGDADSSDAVRDLLDRAVELRKDFNEARTMLAFEYMRRKEYVNCLRHFAMLRKLDPESAFSVYHTAAHAYMQINRPDDARSHAIKAKEFASSPTEIDQAERLIAYIDRPQAEEVVASLEPQIAAPVELVVEFDDEPAAGIKRPALIRKVESDLPAGVDAPPAGAGEQSGERYEWVRDRDLLEVEGNFFRLDCLDEKARFWVDAKGKKEAYAIADPSTVAIEGTSNDVMSFTCGDQQPRRVRVGFIPKPDAELQTAGEVMRIEFQ